MRLQLARPQPPAGPFQRGAMMRPPIVLREMAQAGTSLTLLVEDPDRTIEAIEPGDCRVTLFRDDRDTDLLKGEAAGQANAAAGSPEQQPSEGPWTAEVDPGGHWATVTVHSPHLPSGSATRIQLEGTLVVRYARGERTVEQKNVDLNMDKITATPIPMIVCRQQDFPAMGRMRGVQGGTQVILFYQGSLTGIKKIAFVDADGTEIEAMNSGSGSNGTLNQSYYRLGKKVDRCSVRITIPDNIETATLKISLTTGIGLPPGVRRSLVEPGNRTTR
ncbi:hypothetical protein [Aquisphaera giovannonii]|uniref:hypothetical protein n=1 Tax=Aquisphaera giovannonii TaxID=406548 RepID=UPI001AEF4143|nr:hypothetical protein [Aquisphaera giovannonii]